jgi:DNA-binding CsgD family transcriptional regulator
MTVAITDPLLLTILERIEGAAFVTDSRGRILAANRQASTVYERAATDLRAHIAGPARAPSGQEIIVQEVVGTNGETFRLCVLRAAPSNAQFAARAARHFGLTPRQRQTLELLLDGASNLRIASILGCAERTAEVHVAAVITKMGCANRAGAVACALTLPPSS